MDRVERDYYKKYKKTGVMLCPDCGHKMLRKRRREFECFQCGYEISPWWLNLLFG